MSTFNGTTGDDNLQGSDNADRFNVFQGGDDIVTANDGNDVLLFRGALNGQDQIDGGAGNDLVRVSGDTYSDGLILGGGAWTSVEHLQFGAGHIYNVTSADNTVDAGATLNVSAVSLGAGDSLIFDGSAETDGRFYFVGGAGGDTLTGGAGRDVFSEREGGSDVVHGGNGDDLILMNTSIDATDQLDGGAGSDTVILQGMGLSDSLTWSATSLTSVNLLLLAHGYDYSFVANDANIAAHATMIVEDQNQDFGSNQFFYDGSAETDGHYNFKPELSNATLIGGAQSDRFDLSGGTDDTATGGGGKDLIIAAGNDSSDTFIYNTAADSTSTRYDTIENVDFQTDTFTMPWGNVTSVAASFAGTLNHANFDADLTAAANNLLGAHGALVFTPNSGDMVGHSFLIVDVNGTAGYQTGKDVVIDVTGFTGLNT